MASTAKCEVCGMDFPDTHPGRKGRKFCCRDHFKKYKKEHGCGNKGKKWEETYSPETLKIMKERISKKGKEHFNYLTEEREKELLIKHALGPRNSKNKFINTILKRHQKIFLLFESENNRLITGRTIFNLFFNSMKSKETKNIIIQNYKNNPDETIKYLLDNMIRDKIHAYQRIAYEKYGKKCSICGEMEGQIDVHHKDKDKKNNEIENLQVLCASCHAKLHKN